MYCPKSTGVMTKSKISSMHTTPAIYSDVNGCTRTDEFTYESQHTDQIKRYPKMFDELKILGL